MTLGCSVCGSTNLSKGRAFKPYIDFETVVFDCRDCQCRFTKRDNFIYEKLHNSESTYAMHKGHYHVAKELFDEKDSKGLYTFLSKTHKNKFILDHINENESLEKILEFGCSRGYLSSYSILKNKEFYGIDVSPTAINAAKDYFGDHFFLDDKVDSFEKGGFDMIYHVGTIGCVEDPVGFIQKQVSLLREGGVLLFNAPNLDLCKDLNIEWTPSTTPPDLVTLFPSSFWKRKFSNLGTVEIEVSMDDVFNSLRRRRQVMQNNSHNAKLLFPGGNSLSHTSMLTKLKRALAQVLRALVNRMPHIGIFSPVAKEFGVYVKITKTHPAK